MLPHLFRVSLAFAVVVISVRAAAPEWKDAKGATFRGEPAEVIGPLALFRTGGSTSKFLPLRGLSPEDCRRFHAAIADRPLRAKAWSDAKGEATAELIGKLKRSEHGKLVAFDFTKEQEPELILGVFVGKREGGVWRLIDNLAPFMNRVQRVYPGRAAAVVFPATSEVSQGGSLPGRSWLVGEAGKVTGTKLFRRFGTMQGMACILMTREGVPLFGLAINEVADLMKFVDGASNFLWELNPANPRTARDRAHWLGSVRPVEFAAGAAPPVLLVDPLRVDALRERGVTRVEAEIEVGANGWPTGVTLKPSGVPEPLRPAITEALRRGAIFSPAIEQGAGAPGRHAYTLAIPPENRQLAADSAWVNGEARRDVPFKSWLVLKPIRVPEQVFTSIDRVGPDGVVMLKAVTAGKAGSVSTASQMNAFNGDWFTDAGAGSVRPVAGQKQEVDGTKLTWKAMTPDDGLVDFLGGAAYNSHDYCVGYAWTEIEVPEDTDAWLGIGSDDGLKVWLNGDLVNDKWQQRTSRLDDDVVALRLKKGKNQFLIKIQNAKGLWSFTARLRTRGN